MKLYRALSRVFPRSYRAKLLGVVLCCTFLPMLALVVWLLANNGRSPEVLILGVSMGLAAVLAGTVLSMVSIYHLLEPLRRAADTLDAYYQNQTLPPLPTTGRDDLGRLLHGIHRCLHGIDAGVRELERHAFEDSLTGAMNRRGCEQAIAREVGAIREGDPPFVLFVVDLDNLKPINDAHGHAAGDRLLVEVVESARACCLGKGEWIGRWGGDEFLLGLHGDLLCAQDRVRAWVEVLARPTDGSIPAYVSIGCARHQPGMDWLQLYRHADAAMYQAKFSGGRRLVCHDPFETAARQEPVRA